MIFCTSHVCYRPDTASAQADKAVTPRAASPKQPAGAISSRAGVRLAASKDSGIMVDSSHNLNELTSSSQVCCVCTISVY